VDRQQSMPRLAGCARDRFSAIGPDPLNDPDLRRFRKSYR
jgi:hypothetical protein